MAKNAKHVIYNRKYDEKERETDNGQNSIQQKESRLY